jgi:glycine dehydrogenase subunit 1
LLEEHGIVGGYELGRDAPRRERELLVAVTEASTRNDVDRFVDALAKVLASSAASKGDPAP